MLDQQLRPRGISDSAVLGAMAAVPREQFVPAELQSCAYDDRALDIGEGQTISQPYIVAYMSQALDVRPSHRVLEIGTGSGYQTAILSLLSRIVYTIEQYAGLSGEAACRLARLGRDNVRFRVGDGSGGWPEAAPFDRIMVTAGSPSIPDPLVDQLCAGGRMVIPVGGRGVQRMTIVERRCGRTVEILGIGCRFVKLTGRYGWDAGS